MIFIVRNLVCGILRLKIDCAACALPVSFFYNVACFISTYQADKILLLVSPRYQMDIRRRDNDDETVQSTCYINNRMQAEYWRNRCVNKRFILVLLPGAKSCHAPVWLQNVTLPYHWPDHCYDIVERIRDYPKSRPNSRPSVPVIVTSRT